MIHVSLHPSPLQQFSGTLGTETCLVTKVTEVSPTFLQWAADLEIAENGDISIAVFSADHFFLLSPLATPARPPLWYGVS